VKERVLIEWVVEGLTHKGVGVACLSTAMSLLLLPVSENRFLLISSAPVV